MAKTIIQTIGPLNGEPVNGTVFGRPNGSIYVPAQNTISLSIPSARQYVRNRGSPLNLAICNSSGQIDASTESQMMLAVSQSQDTANYIQFEIAEDSDFTTIIGTKKEPAGQFNIREVSPAKTTEVYTIENGTKYYIRAQLVSGSGVAVATSDVIEVTGWAS